MARRERFPLGVASQASFLSQLAHAVASGRGRITEVNGESHGASPHVGGTGAYRASVELMLSDPMPNPYADHVPGHELNEHIQLAKMELERAFALLNPTKDEDIAKSEELMMFVANKQAEMEGKVIRTPDAPKSKATISGVPAVKS